MWSSSEDIFKDSLKKLTQQFEMQSLTVLAEENDAAIIYFAFQTIHPKVHLIFNGEPRLALLGRCQKQAGKAMSADR